MKKNLPLIPMCLATIQAIQVVAVTGWPRDCECDHPRVAGVPASFPGPEERRAFPPFLTERVSSAASGGSVVVNAGVGELKWEGFAATVSVSA